MYVVNSFETWFDIAAISEEGADEAIVEAEQRKNILSMLHQVSIYQTAHGQHLQKLFKVPEMIKTCLELLEIFSGLNRFLSEKLAFRFILLDCMACISSTTIRGCQC